MVQSKSNSSAMSVYTSVFQHGTGFILLLYFEYSICRKTHIKL